MKLHSSSKICQRHGRHPPPLSTPPPTTTATPTPTHLRQAQAVGEAGVEVELAQPAPQRRRRAATTADRGAAGGEAVPPGGRVHREQQVGQRNPAGVRQGRSGAGAWQSGGRSGHHAMPAGYPLEHPKSAQHKAHSSRQVRPARHTGVTAASIPQPCPARGPSCRPGAHQANADFSPPATAPVAPLDWVASRNIRGEMRGVWVRYIWYWPCRAAARTAGNRAGEREQRRRGAVLA